MLHVTYHHGKSSLYKRYLRGKNESQYDNERNIHKEDEIVSTIIGPLDFLEPSEVYRFWSLLLKNAGNDSFLFSETAPSSANTKFWPRNYVEPDTHVTFKWPGGEYRTLLIEFKWHSKLSGDDQLHRQWAEYFDNQTERDNAVHLFIAPEVSQGISAKNKNNIWGERLVLISWMEIRNTLDQLKKEDNGLARWAEFADYFLHRVGINRFVGFESLIKEPFQLADVPPVLFWGQGFNDK
jgi:hypothetical protein